MRLMKERIGEALEEAIEKVYDEFGRRPIVMGCHKDNCRAAAFYERHGFVKTNYMEGDDYYYIRSLKEGTSNDRT